MTFASFSAAGLCLAVMYAVPEFCFWVRRVMTDDAFSNCRMPEQRRVNFLKIFRNILVIAAVFHADDNIWALWNSPFFMTSAFAVMAVYDGCWIRYFIKGASYCGDYFRRFGLSPWGRVLAIVSFVLLGIAEGSLYLVICAICLLGAHIRYIVKLFLLAHHRSQRTDAQIA